MINTHNLELPLSRTYFHDSKGVRAIEVLLYLAVPWAALLFFFLDLTLVLDMVCGYLLFFLLDIEIKNR